ncbi:MAG: hypothetical protein O3A00_24275 [Planctomycetota bacterium]|nr:hypothetical protein [Planctomycetota bacterium]
MAIRKTLKWFVVILLVIGGSVGGYLYWLYSHSDEILRGRILEHAREQFPDAEISIERARFDWNRRIHVYNVVMQLKGEDSPIVRLPEVVVVTDRDALKNDQQLIIQKVEVHEPHLKLAQDANGLWNWQRLLDQRKPSGDASVPECFIDKAHVSVKMNRSGRPTTNVVLEHGQLTLIPSGKRRVLVDGKCSVDTAGRLAVKGEWDMDAHSWTLTGQIRDVEINRELMQTLTNASHKVEDMLVQADDRLLAFANLQPAVGVGGFVGPSAPDSPANRSNVIVTVDRSSNSVPVTRASGSAAPSIDASLTSENSQSKPAESPSRIGHSAAPDETAASKVPDFGLSGEFDLSFRLAKANANAPVDYKAMLAVRHLHAVHDALPFALNEMSGKIYMDNQQLIVREVHGKHGVSLVDLSGRVARAADGNPDQFDISLTQINLDDRVKERLPPSLRSLLDKFNPRGHLDVEGTMVRQGDRWLPQNFKVSFSDGRVTYSKFRYPLRSMKGSITQQGASHDLSIDCDALAGQWPVRIDGFITNAGPTAEINMQMHAPQFGVDETLLAACTPNGRKTLEALHVQGLARLKYDIHKPAGLNQAFQTLLTVDLNRCSMQPDVFPFRFAEMTGRITFDPHRRTWKFADIKARNGEGFFEANGALVPQYDPLSRQLKPALEAEVFAHRASLDQLKTAVPEALSHAWSELNPSGHLTALTKLRWMTGYPTSLTVQAAELFDGTIRLKSFPYPLEKVNAKFTYANGIVNIKSFDGKHDDTQVRGKGTIQMWPNGQWQVVMKDVYADDLVPDRLFRRALTPAIRHGLDTIDPQGPLSLEMKEIVLTGHANPQVPTTVSWDYKVILYGAGIQAGLDLKSIHGFVTAKGNWNGSRVENHGEINFDALKLLGYQLTNVRGPYRVIDNHLVIGADSIPSGKPLRPDERRVTAKAIDGTMTFDAICILESEPKYRIVSTIQDASLEEYARLYLPGESLLRGKIRGWIDLTGTGASPQDLSGRGRLEIKPAQIYELPVIGQVLKVLSFTTPDKTAFDHVLVDFNVERQTFWFNTIDLVGNAISLRGKGWARFDKKLHLDFYSMLSRNGRAVPFFGALVGEATKGWVGVEVRGTVNASRADVKAIPQLDDALKRFLGAFSPGGGLLPSTRSRLRRNNAAAPGSRRTTQYSPAPPDTDEPRSVRRE